MIRSQVAEQANWIVNTIITFSIFHVIMNGPVVVIMDISLSSRLVLNFAGVNERGGFRLVLELSYMARRQMSRNFWLRQACKLSELMSRRD